MLPGCGYTQPDVQEAKRLEAEHMRYFRAWSARDDKCMNGLVPDPDTVSSEAFANAQKICEAYVPYPPEAVAAEQRYRIARDACWRAHPGDNACPEWHNQPGYSQCHQAGVRSTQALSDCIRQHVIRR